MKSKHRNWAFWILVFSLSMVPLAASGGNICDPLSQSCPEGTVPPKVVTNDFISKPGDVPAAVPVAKTAAKKVVKKSPAKKEAAKVVAKPEAPAKAPAQDEALAARVSSLENGQKAIASDVAEIKKAVTHQETAKAAPLVQVAARQDRSVVITSAIPISSGGVLSDLTSAELKQTFGNGFEIVRQGSGSAETVYLEGRVFEDCAHFFQIYNGSNDPSCGGNPTFRVTDVGGQGRKCVANLRSSNHSCSDDDGACRDLSSMNVPLSLAGTSDHSTLQILHRTLEDNKNNRNKCESLGVEHRTADGTAEDRKLARAAAAYNTLAGPCKTNDDIAAKRQATETLALLGSIDPAQQARSEKSLKDAELALLRSRALHPKSGELDEVASDLNAYADLHPESCKKLVTSYQSLARAYVARSTAKPNRRRHRDEDEDEDEAANPLDGYTQALDMMDTARSYSCFDENKKMADMAQNLELNSVEKDFELNGSRNMETYAHYYDLMGRMQGDVMDVCSGFNPGMECYGQLKSYQNASNLPMYGYEADRRRAQSQMALQQLMMQSAGNGMANASTMQMPGSVGGYYGTGSSGSFGFGRL